MPSTTCGWCGRFANMTHVTDPIYVQIDTDQTEVLVKAMAAYKCDYCRQQVLAYTYSVGGVNTTAEILMENRKNDLMWIPTQGGQAPDFKDTPDPIAEAAQEAYRCNGIGAHRSAVLMARSVIEASAKARGIAKGSLFDKIDEMFTQRLIREDVKHGAHEVRHFGNDMAHGVTIQATPGV